MPTRREIRSYLLSQHLTRNQKRAISSNARRLLVIAGAGSGKTEVMARRVAWWIGVENVPKDSIVAFTFTERAAEEMKYRIREHIQAIIPDDSDVTIGGMYIGTIHGFCLQMLRELKPDEYHNFDVLDESGSLALIQRGYYNILALGGLQNALGKSKFRTIEDFTLGYNLLHEYNLFDAEIAEDAVPTDVRGDRGWCTQARLMTDTGSDAIGTAFGTSAARYYAYLKCRRFLDFSTSQSELVRVLSEDVRARRAMRQRFTHLVVDEVQDINPVQREIIDLVVGRSGKYTAVGDHRQAIYGWRGGSVEIMAKMYERLRSANTGEVVELQENFRSTQRIINIANSWVDTIGSVRRMSSPAMLAGNRQRIDQHSSHIACIAFTRREDEAHWIAEKVSQLVPDENRGASHDTRDGSRGLTYSDIAILLRVTRDARTYMNALENAGIPAVFRAGPDLFSQPEVLLFIGVLARMVGIDQFVGPPYQRNLPSIIQEILQCEPEPEAVIRESCNILRNRARLPLRNDVGTRLILAAQLVENRLNGGNRPNQRLVNQLRNPRLRSWVRNPRVLRRVFPQMIYHLALSEAGVSAWDSGGGRGRTAMFHLGQLSALIKGIETPGWTPPNEFKYQVTALYLWGAVKARAAEEPLLVAPDAVTITTIHGAKGLEFSCVFMADVNAHRFPSNMSRRSPQLPYTGEILQQINPDDLADNSNHDSERRLMYVGLTRAERYLFITSSGTSRSRFFRSIQDRVSAAGGTTSGSPESIPSNISYNDSSYEQEVGLSTNFTDLRYYLECPHDFYLRKVLGFAPTIDQAFGYGRGVHNLMRAIHKKPRYWARLSRNPEALEHELRTLIDRGLFYLRYTTGDPLRNMQNKAVRIIADYITTYADELGQLNFEPEREFETLLEEEQVLVSGAIDIIRLDDPPRVTLVDFKSGNAESDNVISLNEEQMRLQISIYGLAAKHELEYEPDHGLVRYLGEDDPAARELSIDLSEEQIAQAREFVLCTARQIRSRDFHRGPSSDRTRCGQCDYREFCGMRRRSRSG